MAQAEDFLEVPGWSQNLPPAEEEFGLYDETAGKIEDQEQFTLDGPGWEWVNDRDCWQQKPNSISNERHELYLRNVDYDRGARVREAMFALVHTFWHTNIYSFMKKVKALDIGDLFDIDEDGIPRQFSAWKGLLWKKGFVSRASDVTYIDHR